MENRMVQQEPLESQDEVLADEAALLAQLRHYSRAVVALSGGVDSSLVAAAASRALGPHALAVTARSPALPAAEIAAISQLVKQLGIAHEFVETEEFANPSYQINDDQRCYHCKTELYSQLLRYRERWPAMVMCSGANVDDWQDYRPGLRAAAAFGVRHPLQEVGLTKTRVRRLARHWGLANWDKPAQPCLSSRIAPGEPVTAEKTRRVDQAEALLRQLGFTTLRVRYHPGDQARIEVPVSELHRFVEPSLREQIVQHFKAIGFKFIALDLDGFRSGSLNVLHQIQKTQENQEKAKGPSKSEE